MTIRIALVGEDTGHPSHVHLNACREQLGADVASDWVASDSSEIKDLDRFDGIWVVPGSPYADDDAVYCAIRWARESNRPFLGTCGGLQYGVIEFYRHVLGQANASHAESDGVDHTNIVTPLACGLRGESRVVQPVAGTRYDEIVRGQPFDGMHYCGFAPSASAIPALVEAGMVVGATARDAGAEVLEYPANDFYMLSLFQPHIGAADGEPLHPLLRAFVAAAREPRPRRRAAGAEWRSQ